MIKWKTQNGYHSGFLGKVAVFRILPHGGCYALTSRLVGMKANLGTGFTTVNSAQVTADFALADWLAKTGLNLGK